MRIDFGGKLERTLGRYMQRGRILLKYILNIYNVKAGTGLI
jgi:hypothetical protein